MAKPVKPFPLSPMVGGVNRYVQEADKHQATHALDVVQDDGDLRRRDAFNAFNHASPHMLPGGQVTVKSYNYNDQAWTDYSDRLLDGASLRLYQVPSTGASTYRRMFIGCDNPFDGIDLRRITISAGTFDGTQDGIYARVKFVTTNWSNGSTPAGDESQHTAVPFLLDTTLRVYDGDEVATLSQSGMIAWHSGQTPSGWDTTKRTVDGVSAHWIILDIDVRPLAPGDDDTDTDIEDDYINEATAKASNYTITMQPPGVRCFRLEPVTGIYPLGANRGGELIVASKGENRRGQETGGPQLGLIATDNHEPEYVGLAKDWGSGHLGVSNWAGGIDSASGVTGGTDPGTANYLTKSDESYDWQISVKGGTGSATRIFRGSWGNPLLLGSTTVGGTGAISPKASPSPTTTSFTMTIADSYDNEFEDCVMVCIDNGSSGITEGTAVMIKSSTETSGDVAFEFSSAWDGTPASDSEFLIFGIPHMLTLRERDEPTQTFDSSANSEQIWIPISFTLDTNAHKIQVRSGEGTDAGDIPDVQNASMYNGPVNFAIVKEARYELPDNYSPDWTYDEVTRSFLFAFGSYPIQYWDGWRMRTLQALSDIQDPNVQEWTGQINERFAGDQEDPSYLKNAFLREFPPQGRFIQSFANRIFVSGIPGDPTRVLYSAPGFVNNIWPKGYETLVRDPEGNPITGMSVLNDELVVFTTNAIFAAPPPDDLGYMNLTPRSQGLGFINNNVVKKISIKGASVLIGANADGLYMYTGAEPRIVLDEWERVIEGGVNRAALNKACAEVSYFENCYYIAVPSQHSSVPDRLIRFNWLENTFFVYRAPFGGITAMALDRDNNGNETLVFGHADGTMSTFSKNKTDDGDTITGEARTALFSSGGMTMGVHGYMVTLEDTGGVDTVTVKEYKNQDYSNAATLYSGSFDAGGVGLDTTTGVVLDTDKFADGKTKTKRIPAKSGTVAESIQLEITGTDPFRLKYWEILLKAKGQRSK